MKAYVPEVHADLGLEISRWLLESYGGRVVIADEAAFEVIISRAWSN